MDQIKELNKQNIEKDEQIETLKNQAIDDLKAHNDNLQTLQTDLSAMTEKFDTLTKQKLEFENAIKTKESVIQELNKVIEQKADQNQVMTNENEQEIKKKNENINK